MSEAFLFEFRDAIPGQEFLLLVPKSVDEILFWRHSPKQAFTNSLGEGALNSNSMDRKPHPLGRLAANARS